MFVAEDVTLPDPILETLKSYEDSSGHPIRVLYARFRAYSPEPWTADQAAACSTDLENATENGVTVINWGSASSQHGKEMEELPGSCYIDGNARSLEVRDVIVPQDGPRQAIGYFVDDTNEIAEFKDNAVWFFLNLSYLPEPEKLDLDKLLLEPIRRSTNKESMAEFLAEIAEKSAIAFANMMNSNPDRRIQRMRDQIAEQENQLRASEAQVLTFSSELQHRKREMDAILSQTSMPEEHWKQEWRHLAEHPLIVPGSLGMNEMTVSYDTVLLNITDQQTETEIPLGRFRVSINMDTGVVRLNNLNNRRRDRDHPHVANGEPCWGGYHSEVQDHIQSKRLSALVEFIFGYLRTYNASDDWGHYIAYWRENPELIAA